MDTDIYGWLRDNPDKAKIYSSLFDMSERETMRKLEPMVDDYPIVASFLAENEEPSIVDFRALEDVKTDHYVNTETVCAKDDFTLVYDEEKLAHLKFLSKKFREEQDEDPVAEEDSETDFEIDIVVTQEQRDGGSRFSDETDETDLDEDDFETGGDVGWL